MSGVDDAVTKLQSVAANLSSLVNAQRIGNTLPIGSSLGTTVGTTSTQIIGADPSRTGIVFHNAGTTVPLIFCQALDINGVALAATFASPAGGFVVLPLDYLPLSGNVQGAWKAAAQSGSANAVSILTSSF